MNCKKIKRILAGLLCVTLAAGVCLFASAESGDAEAWVITFLPGEADGTAVPGEPLTVSSADETGWQDETTGEGVFFTTDEGTFFAVPLCPYDAPEGYIFTG